MKIAIISDIHDNLVNLEKCLKWCAENQIEKIICCGDVTNGETLEILATYNSPFERGALRAGCVKDDSCGRVYIVRGNMELYDEDELVAYPNIVNGGRTAVWEIRDKKIGVCHEPFLIKELFAKNSLPRKDYQKAIDIIFYGHTHKPWIEDRGGTLIVNPGTLGGVFSRATFAVYDTAKVEPELKILDLL
jgi:uncharacterized protein